MYTGNLWYTILREDFSVVICKLINQVISVRSDLQKIMLTLDFLIKFSIAGEVISTFKLIEKLNFIKKEP